MREQNVVEKDNSTKISVNTSYQGSNHSEVSLTMTYTNVVHSTLHRNQSPDLFSDIDKLNENTEEQRKELRQEWCPAQKIRREQRKQ